MKYRINEICREQGIYLKDLAEKMGRTPESLSRSLNNGTTTKMLQEIANHLNVEVYQLFEGSTKTNSTVGYIDYKGEIHKINSVIELETLLEKINNLKDYTELLKKFIAYTNKRYNTRITDLNSISTNDELEVIINSIRTLCDNEQFVTTEEINSYFKSSIFIFNNLDSNIWKRIVNDQYFESKMDINITDKQDVINQLFSLWENKQTTTIEYNCRGIEVLIRQSKLSPPILKETCRYLYPLIIKAAEHIQ